MEQTVILNLEVDQAQAVTDLQKTEKAILNLKEEQKELNTEYRKGNISQDEYVKHNLKLQQSLKKEGDQKRTLTKLIETESNSRNALRAQVAKLTKEYDNLNRETAEGIKQADKLEKELSQLNSQLTKGDKSAGLFKNQIGNYPKMFGEAANSINIAGTSVGSMATRLASFANPATAAVGIVTALGAAYARSTIGAKDLEFAQNQLGNAITFATNAFAEQISSSEDGGGILSQFANEFIRRIFGEEAAAASLAGAFNAEALEDLARDEDEIRGRISDRLAENQEFLTDINDEQTALNQKLALTEKIESNLRTNQNEILAVLGSQLEIINRNLKANEKDETLLTERGKKNREISKVIAETEKRIQGNERLQNKILNDLAEEEKIRKRIEKIDARKEFLPGEPQAEDILPDFSIRAKRVETEGEAIIKLREDIAKRERKIQRESTEFAIDQERRKVEAVQVTLRAAASIFDEQSEAYRVLASADALVNTYKGANIALGTYPPPFSYVAAAATIAAGLANVAQINGIQFAEGGYTGQGGKYEPAGIVHKGEYVTPQHVMSNPEAKPHLRALENMRVRGYADGGFVTNTNISAAQQSIIMANALKNMPNPVVSWTEGRKVGRRVEVREKVSRI